MQQLEHELKELIIDALMLEDVGVEDIGSEERLFVEGLGLDSIDALELAMAIHKKYGVRTDADQGWWSLRQSTSFFHHYRGVRPSG